MVRRTSFACFSCLWIHEVSLRIHVVSLRINEHCNASQLTFGTHIRLLSIWKHFFLSIFVPSTYDITSHLPFFRPFSRKALREPHNKHQEHSLFFSLPLLKLLSTSSSCIYVFLFNTWAHECFSFVGRITGHYHTTLIGARVISSRTWYTKNKKQEKWSD